MCYYADLVDHDYGIIIMMLALIITIIFTIILTIMK